MTRFPWWYISVRPEDHRTLGVMIKTLIGNLPMSQRELAAALKVDESTVSRWAAGRNVPSLEEMRDIVRLSQARIIEMQTHVNRASEFVEAAEATAQSGLEGIQAMRRVQQLLQRQPTTRKRKLRRNAPES